MTLDSNITVAIAGFLLSLSGVASATGGDFIYIVSARRALQVQLGLLDWTGFLLWDVFYIFAVWTYVAVRGGMLSSKRFVGLAAGGLIALFLGNALKVFVQVYVAVQSGALSGANSTAALDTVDVIGFLLMLCFVAVLAACTCTVIAKVPVSIREGPIVGLASPKSPRD